jgi:hypothetical protein
MLRRRPIEAACSSSPRAALCRSPLQLVAPVYMRRLLARECVVIQGPRKSQGEGQSEWNKGGFMFEERDHTQWCRKRFRSLASSLRAAGARTRRARALRTHSRPHALAPTRTYTRILGGGVRVRFF